MHRVFTRLFFEKPAADGGAGGGADTDADAGEFSADSASVAFTPAPDDSTTQTAGGLDGGPSEMSASAEGVNEGGTDGVDGAEGEETPPAEPAKPAVKSAEAKPAQPGAKKKNVPLTERVASLKKEVDTLTHSKHKTAAELTADQEKLTALRKEIADLEARKASGAAPAKPAEPAKPKAADDTEPVPIPAHPKYKDFDTDEAYEEAVAKWTTDVQTANVENARRLEARITRGVEAKFTSQGSEARAREIQATVVATLEKVRAGKADWNEKATALKGVQSAWYNPEKHSGSTTPFLSDLAMSLLAQGREEGAEILHYLGSDVDRAQRLADLFPTRPLRDAFVHAPSVIPLLEHFATDEGAEEFEGLKRMHPIQMLQAFGALSTRLAAPASSGSGAPAKHAITKAAPSARPPAGSPGARGSAATPSTPNSFEDYMAQEDAAELALKKRLAGIA